MQSELNKELLESLKDQLSWGDENDSDRMQEAANECERICLQKQIELLLIARNHPNINHLIEQLQQQLNQLKQ